MNKTKIFKNKQNIWAFVAILFATLVIGLINYNYPGIYEDTMLPASCGMKFLYPNDSNPDFPLLRSGIVLIPGSHYGAFSAWLQVIVAIIVGGTYKLSFRISILVLASICAYCVYFLLYKSTKNYILALLVAILLSTGANLNIISRSQFDIMYIGAFLSLLAMYQLYLALVNIEQIDYVKKRLIISGFLNGLAFYGYFCYLFLFPAVVLFILLKLPKQEKLQSIIASISAFILGSILYILGYLDSLLTSFLGKSIICIILLFVVFIVAVFYFGTIIYSYLTKKTNKLLKAFFVIIPACVIFAIIAVAFFARSFIFEKLSELFLQISGENKMNSEQKGSIFYRLSRFFVYSFEILQGDRMQQISGGEMIPFMGIGVLLLLIISELGYLCVYAKKKNTNQTTLNTNNLLYIIALYLVSFYVFSLPIINGMWAQHFTIIHFIVGIVIALNLHYIACNIKINKLSIKVIACCIFAFVTAINVYENKTFHSILLKTGGVGPYSKQLDELCKDAYKNYLNGKKEVYVFCDWGFFESFVFFTRNQVSYIGYGEANTIEAYEKYKNKNYTMIYCFWVKELMEEFINKNNIDVDYVETPLQLDGNIAFYKVYAK